ncbi:hypothetical protein AN958_01325 [Leucoagaricus sp. SymC.cos]|nr:hypothetical protein AN958_01325 [Leucoagaricus sp. SymC.cos]
MLSDSKRKMDKKKDKKKGKEKDAELVPPVPAFASMPGSSTNSLLTLETSSDLTVDGIDPRKHKKSFTKPPLIQPSALVSPFEFPGYETDGGKKSKKKSKKSGGNEEKDVKKTRSLFFRLGNKSSKSDLSKESPSPTLQNAPPPPLPIAERFATTLNKETGAPMIALGPGEARLQANGSAPGSGLGIDLNMFTAISASSPSPRTKTPPRPRTADSVMTSSTSHVPPLPSLVIPRPQFQQPFNTSTPPVSFPSLSYATAYGPRPGSAGTTTTTRTSTSTNTNAHSYSTGAARTSTATSVSTSPSQNAAAKNGGLLSREPSDTDVPTLASTTGPGLAKGHNVPVTPSRRRVLPFLGTQAMRSSASSGDSFEKEKKREEKEREKERKKEREREREKEREREPKKPLISLPLTRASPDGEGIPPAALTRNLSVSGPSPVSLSVPNTPHRIRVNGSPVEGPFGSSQNHPPRSPHPPVSHNFQNQQSGLSRQPSFSQLNQQANSNPSRQVSLSTLHPDGSRIGPTPPPGRVSPLLRAPGMNGTGSPSSGSRLSGLHGPPNVFVHYDIPPPSPPPLSPLPSVPTRASPVPSSSMAPTNGAAHGYTNGNASSSGHLTVNVGIAVTTGSPLPSPLLVASPSHGGTGNSNGKVPPTSFNPSSAAAGSALRAKVQRTLSQTGGISNSSSGSDSNATNTTNGTSPALTAPSHPPGLSRGASIRGRESPFPVLPIIKGHSPTNTLAVNNHANTAFLPRAVSPRSGWDDSNSNSDKLSTAAAEEYDDGMDDVRGVIARFRESRINDGSRKVDGVGNASDGAIAARRSFEALQQSAPSVVSNSSLNGNAPASPSPSPSSNVLGGHSDRSSGRYDNFVVEEYYGHGRMAGGSMGAEPSSFKAFESDELTYDEDEDYGPEDASHYPDDEMTPPNRRSRRRRSTVYNSDDEHDTSSNGGHGHGNGKSRYSASLYSRASFLDTEKSGEARQRFLQHVEQMLDERGERAVPPVPKLPEEFVAESRRAAAVARREYEELIMKRTVGVGARKAPAGSGLPVNLSR